MNDLNSMAGALLDARRSGRPADAGAFANALRGPDDAYRVQDEVLAALGQPRDPLARFWKSGGTSRDAALTHAPLPQRGVAFAGDTVVRLGLPHALIEAEVALRLAREVTPAMAATLDHERAATLIDAMAVSVELVASRWRQGVEAPALLKLADLQSHGSLLLGQFIPFRDRDWSAQALRVDIAGRPFVAAGSYALGTPLWPLPAWLRHATRHGQTVPAGCVVTTGTWCGLLSADAGDRVEVEFDGIGSCVFEV